MAAVNPRLINHPRMIPNFGPSAVALAAFLEIFDSDEYTLFDHSSGLESRHYLTYLLKNNSIDAYLAAIPAANNAALIDAVEWTAANGCIDLMLPALERITQNGLAVNYHLLNSKPNALTHILNSPAYDQTPTAEDIIDYMKSACIPVESLLVLFRHPRTKHLLYEIEAPQQVQQLVGWGFSPILLQRNQVFQAYAAVITEERALVRKRYWRAIFWGGVVLRTRMIEFQERYWAVGGKGYLAAKASFDKIIAEMAEAKSAK